MSNVGRGVLQMQEELSEWIVISGKKEYCLTEAQYQHLLKNNERRLVVFDNFSINPAFISSCYKQPAQKLRQIYPCLNCERTGNIIEQNNDPFAFNPITYVKDTCKVCSGTGIDLKAKPNALAIIK